MPKLGIQSVTFTFVGQPHADAHLTVPIAVRRALALNDEGPVFLDIQTSSGSVRGTFDMTSGGEVRATVAASGPNQHLRGVVHGGEWGIASAARP